MSQMFRIILYKQVEGHWHYVRLSNKSQSLCNIEQGRAGELPHQSEVQTLPAAANVELALQKTAQTWVALGYGTPHRSELKVLSLHFSMKSWRGYTAAAPWFEDWKTWYEEPMDHYLQARGHSYFDNGSASRSGDYLVLHRYVLEAEAASAAIQDIAAVAPAIFPFKIYIDDRERYPQVNYNPIVPDEINEILRGFEDVAESMKAISQELTLQKVISATPTYPVSKTTPRVSRELARELREALSEHWGYECNYWIPIGKPAKQEVVFIDELPNELKDILTHLIFSRTMEAIYRVDYDEGISELGSADLFQPFSYEGAVFAADMSWIVYFSHHNSFTFGGAMLIDAVKEHYKDRPSMLNRWL
jgi:hypothetical protein